MFIGSISYNAKLCNVTWNVDGWTTFPKTNKKECIVIYLFHCISTYLQEMNRKRERYIWVWEGIVWESQRFITLLRDHIDIITSGHEWILPCIQSRIVQAAKYCICAWSHTDLAEAAPPRPQRVSGLAVEGDGLAHGVAAAAAAAGGDGHDVVLAAFLDQPGAAGHHGQLVGQQRREQQHQGEDQPGGRLAPALPPQPAHKIQSYLGCQVPVNEVNESFGDG